MKKVYYCQRCIECDETFYPDSFYYTCPKCGHLLLVERDEEWIDKRVGTGKRAREYFDSVRYGRERKTYPYDSGVFMWLPHILPGFPEKLAVSLREGFTYLFEIPDWLKKKLGLKNLYIKMEGQMPSESFKDRGMSIAISETIRLQKQYPEQNIRYVACASTGDTSASAAVYSAYVRDRLKCIVLLPYEKVSPEQLFQAMAHGATVLSIKHHQGFDGCMKLIQEYCKKHPEIVLLNSKNAFRIVGQETISLELCHDLGWKTPDWIAIPCGNGGNLTALLISLLRMRERGLIDDLPGIIVAQTKVANTLVRWAESDFKTYSPHPFKDTIATAMNIQNPVSFPRIQKLYKKFRMAFFDVPEQDLESTRALFMSAGANICPQSAVALNSVMQARESNIVKEDDLVVAISTASGVKFASSGISHHLHGSKKHHANPPRVVSGTLAALEKELSLV